MTNKKLKKGFTLIETLVAVAILMVSIAGPLTLAYKGFASATVAKDQITAFFLAQDALEFIRFARDTNRLAGANWMTGAGGTSSGVDLSFCQGAGTCYLDSAGLFPTAPTACPGTPPVCPVLKYDSTAGTYQYNAGAGANTMFRRTINIITINANEVMASTTVTWTGANGINRSATIFESLTNWP